MPQELKLYGVLDLARAPQLYDDVQRLAPLEARCLFLGEGRLHPEVVRHSPHLVELRPEDPLTARWRSQGWGQAWGIWLESHADFTAVWRRLRRFTQAKLPDGSGPVLFRFWDPRVFRTYLPLVEGRDLTSWFAEVEAYLVEADDGTGSLRYHLHGNSLTVRDGPHA